MAAGWGRAALRYAKVIHDGMCQPCKWLPLAPLPGAFYQLKEPLTGSLLNSDCLPVRMSSFRRAAFALGRGLINSQIWVGVTGGRGGVISCGAARPLLFALRSPICLALTPLV